MIFSPSARQALRAVLYLARSADGGPVGAREIASREGIPQPFLSKLLLSLQKHGIVRSSRGPGGGYVLARPPGRIRIHEVIDIFDGDTVLNSQCLLGLPNCSERAPCVLHAYWKSLREAYLTKIARKSLSAVTKALPDGGTEAPPRRPSSRRAPSKTRKAAGGARGRKNTTRKKTRKKTRRATPSNGASGSRKWRVA